MVPEVVAGRKKTLQRYTDGRPLAQLITFEYCDAIRDDPKVDITCRLSRIQKHMIFLRAPSIFGSR